MRFRNFRVTERQSLDLRADFLNLTNTPILNSPNNGIGPNLGLLQSSQGARNVQFSLKYHFQALAARHCASGAGAARR